MNTLFLDFLNISITASYIILAVILIRFLFPKIPRKFICILWAIAGIRLVLPFSFESVFSLIPSAETVPPDIVMSQSPAIHSGIPMLNSVVNPVISDVLTPDVTESVNPMQILVGVASAVWVTGVAVMLIYGVVSYFRVRKTVSDAVLLSSNIWQSEKVVSPFILGIIRPKIYIPYGMNSETQSHVIAHENAHLRRRDHWIKPLGFMLLAVYWFNPLIWVAYILLCKDIERACDEKVISQMDDENRREYASALLECAVNRRRIAACPLAFGETGLKERVKGVVNYKKPAFWVIVIAVITCVAAAVCFLTNPKSTEYTELGYRLNITEETYTMTTQLPDKTEKKSYKVGKGTKGELSNGTKFEITETNLQTGELTIKFSGEPIYSLVGSTVGNGLQECGQIVINENEPHTLADDSDGVYRRITFEFVKTEDLETAISNAIINTHRGGYKLGTYACEDHEIFSMESYDVGDYEKVTAYMWVNYGEYIKYGESLVQISGSACPTVLTFECIDGKYNLTEYWTAEDGTRYTDSIREKYPKEIVSEVLNYNYNHEMLEKKAGAYFSDNKKIHTVTNFADVSVDVVSYSTKISDKFNGGEYIKLEWQNNSETDSIFYGHTFCIEKFNPDLLGFEEYKPSETMVFNLPELYVEPGQTKEQQYDLGLYDFTEPGYYRFVTHFNFAELDREGVAIVDFTVGNLTLEEKNPEEYTTQAVYEDASSVASGEMLNYTSDICFVNYVEDGESILMKYAEVPMWSPYSSTNHHSVAMFETLQGFNDFYNKTQNIFSYDSFNGYPSLNEVRAKHTKEFFEENNLLIAYISEPSTDIRLEVMSVVRHQTLHIEIRRRVPDACDTAMAGWFVIVGVNKADMEENDLAVARIAETISGEPIFRDKKTAAGTVSYVMMSSNAYVNPYLDLMADNRFHFFISPFSSYSCIGKYRYDADNLILDTDDGLYTYVFRKDGENLIFVEDKSSEIQKYKSSSDSEPVAALKDGDVFVKI